jgi:acylphosphatase
MDQQPSESGDVISAQILLIEGDVQRVGFRRFAERTARRFSVVGSVRNLEDGRVKILAQGPKDRLENFVKGLKIAPQPIVVDRIEIKETRVSTKLKHFEIVTGPLAQEMLEGFGAIESQFGDYRGEFRGFVGEFKDFRTEFKDYRAEFNDFAQRTDQSFQVLDSKYGEISSKLTQILDELRTENREAIRSLDKSVNALLKAIEKLPSQNQSVNI